MGGCDTPQSPIGRARAILSWQNARKLVGDEQKYETGFEKNIIFDIIWECISSGFCARATETRGGLAFSTRISCNN